MGECVTVNTSDFEPNIYDVIRWRFGDQKSPIVEVNRATGDIPKYDNIADGRFRDRLQLDYWTGSLTITHTKPTDSGEYEVDIISNSKYTIHKTFSVTVRDPGLSEGAKAAIGVGFVGFLLVCAVGAGVRFYYRRKISELQARPPIDPTTDDPTMESNSVGEGNDEVRTVSVIQGEPFTLNPDGEHKDDKLIWSFRGFCIAERKISNDRFNVPDDVLDGIFRDRRKLNDQTGSLTITHTTTEHTGVYELLIIRPGKSSVKKFRVSVFDQTDDIKTVSVKKGESVTLKTGVDDIQIFEEILWRFGRFTLLAEIRGGTINSPLEDRLDLDHQTGSLTIKNSKPTDDGVYMLCKIEGGKITTNLFRVEVDPTDNRNNLVEESVRKNNPEENVPLI
ncbi:hypothetical protein F2P79_013799 [Pimephales promelas]|nr:hypothetical protein F2P79_013799 [Pimephales promelas]